MSKYILFIIVFLFSFIINITVSRGETEENIKSNDWDVYHKKANIFRNWHKKGSDVSDLKKNLLLLPMDKILGKTEIKKEPVKEIPEKQQDKLLEKKIIKSKVKLASQKSDRDEFQKSNADAYLLLIMKPSTHKKIETLKPDLKNRTLIFGNSIEKDCYWTKKGCGFSMDIRVKEYRQKLIPQHEKVDSSKFPIDF